MLKRAAKFLPQLVKIFPADQELIRFLPHLTVSYRTALFGLADIQEYYDLDPILMANGTIQLNNYSKFDSNLKLEVEDMVLIADSAKQQHYLDSQVKWLDGAIRKAQEEKRSSRLIKTLR